ncbi:hypothetical protein F3J45_28905 [Pantoea sp. Ap-967]|uniref:hypothetical protein n=1 Tax=Pantoea sp. Ap-967 TaxID=2608362 RepID=UPI001420475D|nr:hypothetical protein [Pantoea sp. Ap-967]NIE78450.1 hypothetical protein [Pantoea sp. Ap-967]
MLVCDPQDVIARLTDAYADIVALDNFALSCQGIKVGRLAEEPAWFTQVAIEFRRLDAAADVWQLDRPLVWLPVLQAFREYATTFTASAWLVAPEVANDGRLWADLLKQRLLPKIARSLAATRAADKELKGMIRAFGSPQPQMRTAIAAGLQALASEPQQTLKPSTRQAHLTRAVAAMGGIQAHYLTLRDALPRLVEVWEAQQASLDQALAALTAGAQPSDCPGLTSLPGALAAWQVIDAFVAHLAQHDASNASAPLIDLSSGDLSPICPSLTRM